MKKLSIALLAFSVFGSSVFAAGPKPPAGLWSCAYSGVESVCDNYPPSPGGGRNCLPRRFYESSSWQTVQAVAVAEAKELCEDRAVNPMSCEFKGCKQSQ